MIIWLRIFCRKSCLQFLHNSRVIWSWKFIMKLYILRNGAARTCFSVLFEEVTLRCSWSFSFILWICTPPFPITSSCIELQALFLFSYLLPLFYKVFLYFFYHSESHFYFHIRNPFPLPFFQSMSQWVSTTPTAPRCVLSLYCSIILFLSQVHCFWALCKEFLVVGWDSDSSRH